MVCATRNNFHLKRITADRTGGRPSDYETTGITQISILYFYNLEGNGAIGNCADMIHE